MSPSIFNSGGYVVLDSGFCGLKELVELRWNGLVGSALIKKCRYWHKPVPGDTIERHFISKKVGDMNAIEGTAMAND